MCINLKVEELKIKVPWGHIAAKLWGPKNVKPMLAIHGWQDNAGTFDTLIPLLPEDTSYLAIDLPGHGLSSHFPDGLLYSQIDMLHTIELIRETFNWEKISFFTHSLGAQLAFQYSSMYPDKSDFFIGIDTLMPHIRNTDYMVDFYTQQLPLLRKNSERLRKKTQPPLYTYNEMVETMHKSSFNSVSTEAAPYLLERAITKSTTKPEKYFFHRDNRLKFFNFSTYTQAIILSLAKNIKIPHLNIKASGSPYEEQTMINNYNEVHKFFKENNPLFESTITDGTHHVHLNYPLKISGTISNFINKYKQIVCKPI